MDADARASSAESNDYHLGAYAGTQLGALGLRTGLSYSFHDIESARAVSGGGLTDHLTADYDTRLFQAYGEAGYRVNTAMAELESFASLAYLTLDTDGFSETGGAAALSVQSATTETVYSTLGLRADKPFTAEGKELTLGLMAGWQHAFGDRNASSINAFAGGTGFAIDGAPIAEDSLVMEAGLSGAISVDAGLSVAYRGQLSDEVEDHGLTARLTLKF
jgi:outer membrane autotransporter protein